MSKVLALHGPFTDAAGKEHVELTVQHGNVFFNADDPDHMLVIVVDTNGVENNYTTPHSDVLNGGLISAGASYRSLEIVG
jgi:hypothetical protein